MATKEESNANVIVGKVSLDYNPSTLQYYGTQHQLVFYVEGVYEPKCIWPPARRHTNLLCWSRSMPISWMKDSGAHEGAVFTLDNGISVLLRSIEAKHHQHPPYG